MAEERKVNVPSSDNPSLQISPTKFDGQNYLAWSRYCLLFIKARVLQGYINGSKKQPEDTDPSFPQWDSENSLVMTWLLNSMQPHMFKSYLLLNTPTKIWKTLSLTYCKGKQCLGL